MDVHEFQELVWHKGRELYRDMPWRDEPIFYYVLVSEIMLQQTQVPRVLTKFAEFMERFPTIEDVAAASLADILRVWQGLGYNRRAKYLHEAAHFIAKSGLPTTREELVNLPGIGQNTAAAIMNYVYEVPTAYVETNIRTVYFYHFFADRTDVSDEEVLEMVEMTIDREHPRAWFWALMDYGSELKSQGNGRLDTSRHYKKQSPLEGSVRQVRGKIITALSVRDYTQSELRDAVHADERFEKALNGLMHEKLVSIKNDMIHLTR